MALSGDTMALSGSTLALSGDTLALLGDALALSGDTMALQGIAQFNSPRINEILYLADYVVWCNRFTLWLDNATIELRSCTFIYYEENQRQHN